jgi:hypothetical protein
MANRSYLFIPTISTSPDGFPSTKPPCQGGVMQKAKKTEQEIDEAVKGYLERQEKYSKLIKEIANTSINESHELSFLLFAVEKKKVSKGGTT